MSIETPETVSQEAASTCEVEPAYWGQTTDPSQHNPDNFRYLVHAFNPFLFLTRFIHQRKQVLLMMRHGVNLLTYELGQRILMSDCL